MGKGQSPKAVLAALLLAAWATGAPGVTAEDDREPRYLVRSEATGIGVRLVGDPQRGFDVVFETRYDGTWHELGGFPAGPVWGVSTEWKDAWYNQPHPVKASEVRALEANKLQASARATIDGHGWAFRDVYSIGQAEE